VAVIVRVTDKLVPSPFQLVVELVEHDVRAQRTQRSALRHADFRVYEPPTFYRARPKISVDEREYPPVLDIPRQYLHQLALIDGIEELFQVHIHCPLIALFQVFEAFAERAVGASSRSEPVACFHKLRLVYRRQHLRDCLLDDTVYCCRNPQFSCLPVVLRDFHPPDRLGRVCHSQD